MGQFSVVFNQGDVELASGDTAHLEEVSVECVLPESRGSRVTVWLKTFS